MYHLFLFFNDAEINGNETTRGLSKEGQIVLKALNVADNTELILVNQTHNLSEVLGWFRNSAVALKEEYPPSVLPHAESLAKAIRLFYDSAPDDLPDSEWDAIFAFRTRHDLRFAFRGCDIPSTLIGTWNGFSTLSSEYPAPINIDISLPHFLAKLGL